MPGWFDAYRGSPEEKRFLGVNHSSSKVTQ
jgi:hypothetical protein